MADLLVKISAEKEEKGRIAMASVIITVTDEQKSFWIDAELPQDKVLRDIKEDILAVSRDFIKENSEKDVNEVSFFCSRTQSFWKEEETLEKAGIWNGDYIILSQK